MKLFKFRKKDKISIFKNALKSFDFNYVLSNDEDAIKKKEPKFADVVKNIDTSLIYNLKEVDYYA